MSIALPAAKDSVVLNRRALSTVRHDEKARRAARLKLSNETGYLSLGPGMF